MKIGLLPLYVKLYDDKLPELRLRLENFYTRIAAMFRERNVEVVTTNFCRLSDEFERAVHFFELQNVDAIVTIHMAYSPSLESIDTLSNTKLPIVVLDTTETIEFTNKQDPAEIMYCHGIHGVMDMCSMLTRRGKKYAIASGHYKNSNCIDKACGYVRVAAGAKSLDGFKVGLIGGLFEGMGDFQVSYEELKKRFGITVLDLTADEVFKYYNNVSHEEIQSEIIHNDVIYSKSLNIVQREYEESIKSGLAVRKCVNEKGLNAFSINFTNMGKGAGLSSMPFIECCKSMERGIGYAGEGDVMTAAFTGALLHGYPETTFIEIFCPDWKNNLVFLSHMGEVNYRIADIKPKITRAAVNYSPGEFPYVGYTRMKGGKGVYLNISRNKDDYKLILSSAEMVSYRNDNFDDSIRGWMSTNGKCSEFLKNLSLNGATHHSIFIYGATTDELKYFGELLNLETVII